MKNVGLYIDCAIFELNYYCFGFCMVFRILRIKNWKFKTKLVISCGLKISIIHKRNLFLISV